MDYNKSFKLEIGSHYFKVIDPDSQILRILYRFNSKYSLKGFVRVKGRTVCKTTKVFSSNTKDLREFRYHIGLLADFYKQLEAEHIDASRYDTVKKEMYVPKTCKYSIADGWKLREQQLDCKNFVLKEDDDDLNSKLISMPTGTGKFQSLSAAIKIPGGWTTMGELKLNDPIIAQNGNTCHVTGIYPQGVRSLYKITFEDGRSTDCGLEHLWCVITEEEQVTVINTQEIVRLINSNQKLFIPLSVPEHGVDVELPLQPYLLGSRIQDHKSVPYAYLNASLHQRLYLLQGIMDVGGTVDIIKGTPSYATNIKQLALDVQYLIRSVGGIAKITNKYTRNGLTYIVNIKLPNNRLIFNKPSKLRKLKEAPSYSNNLKLRITSVEFLAEEEARCISISDPSKLYVTDDFIVTHNTVTGLITLSELQSKVLIVVLPSYMEKWAGDVSTILKIKKKEIMLISGANNLKGLMTGAVEGTIDAKFIIISLRTINNYFKTYEEKCGDLSETGYDLKPEELCETLNIGSMLIDETHQHLHAVYKLLSYMHVPRVLALSATLISDDPMISKIQHLIFPREIRFDEVKMKKYIKCYAISYNFRDIHKSKIRSTEFGSKSYSHIAFEKSIIKNNVVLGNYLKIIADLTKIGYINDYQKGDKLLIFAASINMCTIITEYIKKLYPDKDVRRYVEADPYENAIDADIRVSSLLSLGTAIDVPGLRATIMTTNVNSPVSNLQGLGRLRELKDRDVKFMYMYSDQIPKQREYHKKKMDLFYDRVAFIKEFKCPIVV